MGYTNCGTVTLAVLELMLLFVMSTSSLEPAMAPETAFDQIRSRVPPAAPQPSKVKKFHVAVEGVIFCRGCRLAGYNQEHRASPLPGAVAKLQCDFTNTSRPYIFNGTTNDNGYFFFLASPRVSNLNIDSCKVFLVSSPMAACQKPSNYNKGVSGAPLKYEMKITEGVRSAYNLYTAGILYFAPTHHNSCQN